MIGSKKLLVMLRPMLNEMSLSDEVYGRIMRMYSPACKCSPRVKTLDYSELCKLSNSHNYMLTIIQNEKIFDTMMNNCFRGAYEHISACYQINPFCKAIVIARNNYKYNSFRVFYYEPSSFDKVIVLPHISCFKPLFEYFNVYKADGTLVENLDDLIKETEVMAISKETLKYNCYGKSYTIHIILRWYEGYF